MSDTFTGGCATSSSSPTTPSGASTGAEGLLNYFVEQLEHRRQRAGRRPAERAVAHRGRREARRRRHHARHGGAGAHRRGRHDVERHRLVPLAPGHPSRGPAAAGGRARADAHRGRGAAAGLLAGHHGPRGDRGHRVRGLPHEGRRQGADELPRRQPRSRGVRGPRRGAAGPGPQSPRGVRLGHPPLRRLEPGPHGAAGGAGGVAGTASPSSPSPRARRSRWAGGQVRGPRVLPVVF